MFPKSRRAWMSLNMARPGSQTPLLPDGQFWNIALDSLILTTLRNTLFLEIQLHETSETVLRFKGCLIFIFPCCVSDSTGFKSR